MAALEEMVKPATLIVAEILRADGYRERTLTLPVMMGLVLAMIWRQVGSVREAVRIVQHEVVLWLPKQKLTPQALNLRMRVMPESAFRQVLEDVLPKMQARWEARTRPIPEAIAWAQKQFSEVLICDGSTLDALIRKVGLLKDHKTHPLAGRMMGVLNMVSRLPVWIGYTEQETAHDQSFWREILTHVKSGALLVFDLGFINYARFAEMTDSGVTFITRAKTNLASQVAEVIAHTATVHDDIVWIGGKDSRQKVRLVQMLFRGTWYRYLTNELSAERLPAEMVINIYRQRWRIEEAFNIVKSLLGLSYFYSGSQNAIKQQLWATWILYATLVDLTDAVAQALNKPFADISMEMVYRSIRFFVSARHAGEATDIVDFFVAEHKLFGLIKRKKKPPRLTKLALDSDDFSLTCH